jgi:hypothetical protein
MRSCEDWRGRRPAGRARRFSKAGSARPSSSSMPMSRVVDARSRSSSVSIFSRTRLLTRVISCRSLTGLVRKSSAPASSPRTRSDTWSSAVTMTTGICDVAGSPSAAADLEAVHARHHDVEQHDVDRRARRSPARPARCRVSTSKYSASSRTSSSFTLAGMSSTTRMRAVISHSTPGRPTRRHQASPR